jgi:phage terminase small subunit
MGPLKNIRHEKFCQGIVRGLSQTKAYTAAGYSKRGAKQSAARLRNNPDVRSRASELRQDHRTSIHHRQRQNRVPEPVRSRRVLNCIFSP